MPGTRKNTYSKDNLKEHWQEMFQVVVENMDDVVAVFDKQLNYLLVNEAACKLLHKTKSELLGKNLLDLFPQLTASNSHRYLLQAISGQSVKSALSEGTFTKAGAKYISNYYPLIKNSEVRAVLAVTKKLYYPKDDM
jgi:PAS domain S-box-containing protein